MKSKGAKCLTWTQRLQLESLLKTKLHKMEIANILGISLATVYNEIKRGEYQHKYTEYDRDGDRYYLYKTEYSAQIAHDKYLFNMTAKGAPLKVGHDYDFIRYIESRVLKDKISPCAVLGEIKRKRMPFATQVSKTTLYRYIEIGLFENLSMKNVQNRKKRYRKANASRPPRGTSIEKRPKEIDERNTFGHWEMDCVCGPTRPTLLVLSERLTRKEIIMRMDNQKAESVIKCLNILERKYGKMFRRIFKTITVDNGAEFSDVKGIERSSYKGKRTTAYYCHPYCSCERGTNERLNREIRRLLPKGTDFTRFAPEDIQKVEDWVNAYPRQVLGYATSAEMFAEQLQSIE